VKKPTLAQLKELPPDAAGLLEVLENSYPPKNIQPDESFIDAHRYAAISDLVQTLKRKLK
jgi:hypothetical protein